MSVRFTACCNGGRVGEVNFTTNGGAHHKVDVTAQVILLNAVTAAPHGIEKNKLLVAEIDPGIRCLVIFGHFPTMDTRSRLEPVLAF